VQFSYENTETVGKHCVIDNQINELKCVKCGTTQTSLDELGKSQLRIAYHLMTEAVMDKEIFRYTRKSMGYSKSELASELKCSPEEVDSYESGVVAVPKAVETVMVENLRRLLGHK
jgi:ribosome-binding protein aMBF1 (putative translation factor)